MYSLKKEARNPVAWNKPCQKPDANMTAHHPAMMGMMSVAAGYRRSQGAPGHHGASPSLWELAGCVRRNDGLQPIRKKHVHLPLLKDVWILGLDLVPFSQQLEYVQNKQKKKFRQIKSPFCEYLHPVILSALVAAMLLLTLLSLLLTLVVFFGAIRSSRSSTFGVRNREIRISSWTQRLEYFDLER